MKSKIILIIALLLSGCARDFYSSPEGEVMKIKGDMVCVVYPVLSGKGGMVYNCYFFEKGHSYELGDRYPDFNKHQKGFSYEIR